MKEKLCTLEQALEHIHDGQSIMFGDLHGEFAPEELISAMLEKGVKDITAIATSGGMPDQGLGRLIAARRVKKLMTTHIGLNSQAVSQMLSGELEVEFIPQGTFAERIRAGGYGLGGVLTPTGIGTEAAVGKQIINVDGKDYLLEKPIRADIALVKATRADRAGNLYFRMCSVYAQDYMCFAADRVICEAEELVETGALSPEQIDVPAPIVDMVYLRRGEKRPICSFWKRQMAGEV